MTLENLIGKGLQKERAGKEELARFRNKIAVKLADAQNTTLSLDTRFDVAYEALLQIGLAALRANGYRPDSRGGHHVMALQTLPTTIGYPKEKVRLLDDLVDRNGRIFFTHDPTAAMARVTRDEKGRYGSPQARPRLAGELA